MPTPLADVSDRMGDPSSWTKGFSYSLARVGAALDVIPAALMLRLSVAEALRECENAILLDYVTSSRVIRERICSTFITLGSGGNFVLIDTRRGETCQSLVLHAKKFAYWSLPAFSRFTTRQRSSTV
jgi:hypothetical protein